MIEVRKLSTPKVTIDGEQVTVVHDRYRFKTDSFDEEGNPLYYVVYFESSCNDIIMDGFTPYTEEELANVPDIDPENDLLMEALRKIDGKIKRIRISSDPDDPYALFKVGKTMVISENNVLDRKETILEDYDAFLALDGEREDGRLYFWIDDGYIHYDALDVHNNDSTAHKDIRDALAALAGGVASVERAMLAGRLDPGAKINGVLFDGSKDIQIEVDTTNLVAKDSEQLGGIDASMYALKSEVYLKSETYSKEETYSKAEVDAMSGVIPGGKIYIE